MIPQPDSALHEQDDDCPTWLLFLLLTWLIWDDFTARVTNRFRPMRVNQFRDSQAFMLDVPESRTQMMVRVSREERRRIINETIADDEAMTTFGRAEKENQSTNEPQCP